jgi:acid phosphatase
VPLFDHVFLVVMENTSLATLQGADNTPFLAQLATDRATSADYHGVTHPSLPNYIALVSGSDQGIACDCKPDTSGSCNGFTCNLVFGGCGCEQSTRNLADDVEAAGLDWRAYAEDMGTPCNTQSSGNYAVRHVPFLYFDDVKGNAGRCGTHVVDFGGFASELQSGLPALVYVAPNLVDDMHDPFPAGAQNLANGDTWLGQWVPQITASSAFAHSLVIVVWDEDDNSGGITGSDDPIPLFILSPYAKTGYESQVHADHFALLATIEDGLALPRLGNAAAATPLADFFPAH